VQKKHDQPDEQHRVEERQREDERRRQASSGARSCMPSDARTR
jgi:hypothetical protein